MNQIRTFTFIIVLSAFVLGVNNYKGFDCVILSTSNRIPTRGQSQIGSHVYFLLIIAMVILL